MTGLTIFLWISAILISFIVYGYYRIQITKMKTNLNKMENSLATIPITMSGINGTDAQFQYRLRDYYIASSYNSCCVGDFINSYVSLEGLTNVIKRGCRLLDFEIYSWDKKVVVAASGKENYHFKGTYNSLPIAQVFDTINRYAFSAGAPNPHDPLFIHLRVKSNLSEVYTELANTLSNTFDNLLSQINPEYAYESHGENITQHPLLVFQNKIMIICDSQNNNFRKTPLEELINLTSNSQFLRGLTSYNVEYTTDMSALLEYNKKQMSIVLPDLSVLNNNQNAALQQKYGCQMTCMSYQNLDTNLDYYLKFFANSAFVLKPKSMRYIPVTFTKPPPQDPQLSYAPRTISMPQFQGNI